MHRRYPLVTFLAARTGLLVVVLAVLWLVGLRGFPLLVLALFVSSVVSIFALSGQRDAVSGQIEGRVSRMRHRLDEAAASEDE